MDDVFCWHEARVGVQSLPCRLVTLTLGTSSPALDGNLLAGPPSNTSYFCCKQNQDEMSTGNWGSIQEIIVFLAHVRLASGPQ